MNWERKRFSMKNKCKCYSFLTLKDKEIRTCSQEPQIESGRALLFTQLALLERKFFNFSQKKLNLYVFTSFRHYVFPSLSLSLREFKKSLPNTFIYESILIKIYANVNIMKSQNVTFMFILTLTYVLMDIFYPCFFQRFNDIKNLWATCSNHFWNGLKEWCFDVDHWQVSWHKSDLHSLYFWGPEKDVSISIYITYI